MSRYAATTAVSVSKSKVEIDAILTRYKADTRAILEEPGRWQVILDCGCDVEVTARNVSQHIAVKRFVAPKTGRCPGHCCAL